MPHDLGLADRLRAAERTVTDLKAARVDIRDELLRFHARHYSANAMKLVVLGTDLDALQATVERCFAPIRNTGRAPTSFAAAGVNRARRRAFWVARMPMTQAATRLMLASK